MMIAAPPSPDRSATLPYLDIDERPFEELCRDLLATQPGIDAKDVELFETKGLPQFGIDILGRGFDGAWVAVSCKRYTRMTPANLRKWCDEFLEHWTSKWLGYPILRFVLAVSVRLNSEAARQEAARQKERFGALGIVFELWHAKALDHLLRAQPDLVRRHFNQAWADQHCGVVEAPPVSLRSDARLISFERNVSEDVQRLVEAREHGLVRESAVLVERLGRAAEYSQLEEGDRHTYRRIVVSDALDVSGYQGAEAVRARFPGPIGADLEALIALDRDGEAAAFEVLNASEKSHGGIRAQLLMAAGEHREALQTLEGCFEPLDSSIRAKALAALGCIEEAMEVQRAAESFDDGAAVARTGLAVRFACVMAPSLGTCVTSTWPEPLPEELFRRDDEALALMREGAEIALVRSRTPGMSAMDRRQWLTWHVAFLCCDEGSRSRAASAVRESTERGEVSPGMVIWALWCDLDFDRRRAINEMEKALRLNGAHPEQVFALLFLYEAEGMTAKALRELRAANLRFGGYRGFAEARDQWTNRLEGAASADLFIETLDGAVREGHWEELEGFLEDRTTVREEAGRRLVLAARAMARFGRFDELARIAERLVSEIGTAYAIELAAQGWAGTGEWQKVAALLADTRSFAGGALPPGPASLLAEARTRTGDIVGALAIRRSLVGTAADPQGFTLARSLLAIGDIGGAASITATVDLAALSPHDVAMAIAITRISDPSRARSLAERVFDLPTIPDELLPHLFEHGYALGLDHKVGPLLAEAIASSRISGKSMSLDDLMEHMKERRRVSDELNEAHRRGELPMALFAKAVNLDTAELVLGGRHVGPEPLVLAQHGGRRGSDPDRTMGEPPLPGRPSRLALDLPALLLAQRFGFLLDVRRAFGTLCLPDNLMFALAEAISRAAPHQVSVSEARARVGAALDRGVIKVSDEPAELEVGDPDDGANLPYDAFMADLPAGAAGAEGAGATAPLTVRFMPGRLEQLAGSDLWEVVLDRYVVVATTADRDRVAADLAADRHDADRRNTLLRLVEEVSDGLVSGRYELMEASHGANERNGPAESADEAVLISLLGSTYPEDCVLFSGDRCINGFVSIGNTPVAGIVPVLGWMLGTGVISAARRRSIMGAMRDANVHFAFVDAEDLERALMRASVQGQRLTETPELRAMRRHVATGLRLQPYWRLDETTGLDGQSAEYSLVRDATTVLVECLRQLWLNSSDDDARVARADYIVEHLLTDRLERIPLAGGDAGKIAWFAMFVGRLYGAALEVGLHGHFDRAAHLLGWTSTRLVGRWTSDATAFSDQASAVLASLVDIMTSEKGFPESWEQKLLDAYRVRVSQVLELLPEEVLDGLAERLPSGRLKRREEYVVVGGRRIVPGSFDEAIRIAAVDGAAEIRFRSKDQHGVGVIGRRDARHGIYELISSGDRHVISDLRLSLISRSSLRLAPVQSLSELGAAEAAWLDGAWSDGCSSMKDAERIIEETYSFRIRQAERALESGEVPASMLHPPSPMVLDRHLDVASEARGSVSDWLAVQTDLAAEELVSGSCPRLRRLLHLPIQLGASLREAFDAANLGERPDLLATLLSLSGSVIARAHSRSWTCKGHEETTRFENPTLPECAGLRALFRWVWRVTEQAPSWRALEMPWRLSYCWYHASQLSLMFSSAGQSLADVTNAVDAWDVGAVEAAIFPVHPVREEMAGPEIAAETIYLALFLHGCPEPDEQQLSALSDVVVLRMGERAYPVASIIEARSMPDVLGSLFSSTRSSPPPWLVKLSSWLDPETIETELIGSPPWEEEARNQGRAWSAFLHMRRRHLPLEEGRSTVRAWKEMNLAALIPEDREWATAVALLCSLRGDLDEQDQLWLADALNGLPASKGEEVSDELRMEAAVRFLVRSPKDRSLDELVLDTQRIDGYLRSQSAESQVILVRLARDLGPVDTGGLWERIVSLRMA